MLSFAQGPTGSFPPELLESATSPGLGAAQWDKTSTAIMLAGNQPRGKSLLQTALSFEGSFSPGPRTD